MHGKISAPAATQNSPPRFAARIRGLYAITPMCADDSELFRKCTLALQGGANVLQYRDKTSPPKLKMRRAFLLRQLCTAHGALFIVNDDIALAKKTDADGVHLGANDTAVVRAREICGDKMILGATCGDDILRAKKMLQQGAEYCAFGAVFLSPTKPAANRCSLETISVAAKELNSANKLNAPKEFDSPKESDSQKEFASPKELDSESDSRKKLHCPIVAVGGITAQNAASVFRAGANAVAVCAGIFAAADIENNARQIAAACGGESKSA